MINTLHSSVLLVVASLRKTRDNDPYVEGQDDQPEYTRIFDTYL